jgi:uncharacterized protein
MLRSSYVRPIESHDLLQAIAIANQDPVANCFLLAKLAEWQGVDPLLLLVYDREGNAGLAYIGINTTTANCSYEMLTHLADYLSQSQSMTSSIIGYRDDVFGLWEQVSTFMGPARLIRADQPLLVLNGDPLIEPNPAVRLATSAELELVLPAAAMMFREEVGIDPLRPATSAVYRSRVAELLAANRTYILLSEDEVIFKADIGVLAESVIQVQGVWVAPNHRGHRISAPALAAAILMMQQIAPTISLYVNDFNYRAIRLYRSLGFQQVGTFASVML